MTARSPSTGSRLWPRWQGVRTPAVLSRKRSSDTIGCLSGVSKGSVASSADRRQESLSRGRLGTHRCIPAPSANSGPPTIAFVPRLSAELPIVP